MGVVGDTASAARTKHSIDSVLLRVRDGMINYLRDGSGLRQERGMLLSSATRDSSACVTTLTATSPLLPMNEDASGHRADRKNHVVDNCIWLQSTWDAILPSHQSDMARMSTSDTAVCATVWRSHATGV